MPSLSSPLGELAEALCANRGDARVLNEAVSALLLSSFPGWRELYPPERGWQFVEPATLHVFGTADSPAGRGGCALAGFVTVVVHPHGTSPRAMEACRCMPREILT